MNTEPQLRDQELEELAREEEKEQKALVQDMENLLSHPGWSRLSEILQKQLVAREQEALYYTDQQLERLETTRDRVVGEAWGIRMMLAFPNLIIEGCSNAVEAQTES